MKPLPNGLIVVAKRECPTCVLVEPLLRQLAEGGTPLTVYSQDDPGFAAGAGRVIHDETLERVFWAEVFPEAIDNLRQVAGEWGMLTLHEPALIKRANHGSIPWLARRAHGWMVQDSWLAARQVTGWLRDLPEDERVKRVTALDLLGHRFFEEPARESAVATPARMNEVLAVARQEWVRYEPVCRAMLGADEKSMPADGCAAAVRTLLGR